MLFQDIINISLLVTVLAHTVSIIILHSENRRLWRMLDQLVAIMDKKYSIDYDYGENKDFN